MLKAVYEDPDLSPTTKRAIEEAIMSKPHEFGAAEQALTVEVVEARGEARAQARERETLLEVARRRGVSEARFARLEALESLDALREAVFELLG